MTTGTTIDPTEVNRFNTLSARWWDERGPMAALHAMNPVRLEYLRDKLCAQFGRNPVESLPLAGLRLLDVGCGAGLLCEPLTRMGASVTGIDAAADNITVAAQHADAMGLSIDYREAVAEDLTDEGWDAILAMEVVEHVPNADAFVSAVAGLVRPGGLFLGATLNRTARSLALAVGAAEYIFRWVPRGTHDWRRFITPAEFGAALRNAGLEVGDVTGILFKASTGSWAQSRDVRINYILSAERPAAAPA